MEDLRNKDNLKKGISIDRDYGKEVNKKKSEK